MKKKKKICTEERIRIRSLKRIRCRTRIHLSKVPYGPLIWIRTKMSRIPNNAMYPVNCSGRHLLWSGGLCPENPWSLHRAVPAPEEGEAAGPPPPCGSLTCWSGSVSPAGKAPVSRAAGRAGAETTWRRSARQCWPPPLGEERGAPPPAAAPGSAQPPLYWSGSTPAAGSAPRHRSFSIRWTRPAAQLTTRPHPHPLTSTPRIRLRYRNEVTGTDNLLR